MKKIILCLLITCLFLSCEQPFDATDKNTVDENPTTAAVSATITFAKNYGEPFYDEHTKSLIKTSDGGYILFGTFLGPESFYLIKTDRYGNLQWQKTFGDPSVEGVFGTGFRPTPDGGFVMIGNTELQTKVEKIDKFGNVQWVWYGDRFGNSIALSNDNGYVGVESTTDTTYTNKVTIFKLSAGGQLLWSKKYFAGYSSTGRSIERTSDNGFIIAGTASFEDKGQNVYMFKIDGQGNLQWQTTWGGNLSDEGNHAIQTSDGGYAVIGSNGKENDISQVYLIKTDSHGRYQWIKGYFPSSGAHGNKIIETSDHGFAIAGSAYSKVSLIKVSSTGSLQWRKSFEGNILSDAEDLVATSDGGYALTGLLVNPGFQATLIKTDKNGNF